MKTKSKKTDLERHKLLFFQIGCIIALAAVLAAFEWPSKGIATFNVPLDNTGEIPYDEIPITKPEDIKPPPPPPLPKVAEVINIHSNDTEDIVENPDIFKDVGVDIIPELLKTKEEEDVDEVIDFMLIEEKPTFMGGNHNDFAKWVFQNVKYPDLAIENRIQGRVFLQFIIDEEGFVRNVEIIRGADPLLNKEAVRIVSSSPQWTPGKQRNKPTKVKFTFPVTFKLE
ncbi:MAG: energy transducer TonB [Bacteroidales bacterium]